VRLIATNDPLHMSPRLFRRIATSITTWNLHVTAQHLSQGTAHVECTDFHFRRNKDIGVDDVAEPSSRSSNDAGIVMSRIPRGEHELQGLTPLATLRSGSSVWVAASTS